MNLWSSESVEGAPRRVRGNTVTTLKTQRVNTNTLWGDNREALMFCFVCCHGNMCVTAPQPLIIITDRILSKPTNTAPDCSRMCVKKTNPRLICTLLGCFYCCSSHLLLYVQSVSSHGSSRWLHLRDSSYQQTTRTSSHISSRAALKCCAQCACQWQLQSAELWSEIKNTTTHIIIDMCNYNLHHYDNNDFINKGLTGSPVGYAVSSTQHTVVTWHLITQLIINK